MKTKGNSLFRLLSAVYHIFTSLLSLSLYLFLTLINTRLLMVNDGLKGTYIHACRALEAGTRISIRIRSAHLEIPIQCLHTILYVVNMDNKQIPNFLPCNCLDMGNFFFFNQCIYIVCGNKSIQKYI